MDRGLRQRCQQHLRRLQQAARRRLLVHAVAAWCAVAGAALLALLLLLGLTEPPYWVRLGLTISGLALVAPLLVMLAVRAGRATRSRAELARRLDRAGGFDDTLAAAEEALRQPERWRTDTPVRTALVERLLARASRLSADLDLPRLLPVGRPVLVFVSLALVLGAGAWLQADAPEVADRGWRRLAVAWRPPVVGGAVDLRLAPGPDHVVAGASIAVAALDLSGGVEPVVCEIRAGSGLWRQVPARLVPQPGADPVLGAPFERWETVLDDVQDDLVYRFRRADRQSLERSLAVWRPPLLARLSARVDPPGYTALVPQSLERLPAYFEVPVGSRLTLAGRSSQPLDSAVLVAEPADSLVLAVDGQDLTGTLTLDQARRFRLHLQDDRGLVGRSELVYEVAVIPDRVPLVRLERPDDDGHLPLTAPLSLMAAADDDYGLAGMDLLLRRGDADGGVWVSDLPGGGRPTSDADGWERVPLAGADGSARREPATNQVTTSLGRLPLTITPRPSAQDGGLMLDLQLQPGSLALVPGDVLELAVEARDNRVPGPPGVGRSAILRLQVPSSLELLDARDESGAGHRDDLAEMRRRSEALSADMERLRRELLKDPSPDWDRRQELLAAVERQQALQAEMSRLAESMQQDLESLAESRLTSPEIMERMDRIAELMKQAQSGSMEEMLAKLQDQLEQMSSKELSMTMEDLTRDQTEMMRRLDTAMSMLQDLAREQEMEGLTDLLAQMLAKQQELAEASREAAAQEGQEGEEAEGENTDGAKGEESEDGEAGQEGDEGQDGQDGESAEESGDQEQAAGENESGESQDQSGENQDQSGENQDQSGESQDPTAENEELARRQEALADELEAMEERLRETLEEMRKDSEGEQSAAEQEMQKALEEALEQMEQQQTGETMEQAGENLKQEMSQEASEQMQQALTDLAGLYHVMLRSQMAMQMAMQQEQAGNMRDLAADLLSLSERQEQLGLDLPTNLRDVRVDDLARRQHVILQGSMAVRDGLADVAGAAPQEVMRMLEQIDQLLEGQGRALNQLEDGRARGARQASDASLAEMNRLVINLLTQAQMTGQGGGSGSPQPMLSQQLRQMSEQQSGLNALAEQLRQNQGRMSEQMRAGMKRLQQGQQGLAGQARRLAEEQEKLGEHEGGRLLGDIDQLAQDMERVGDDLGGGLITEETVRRQERILSRLLDMHNASRERDWARRRESRAADEIYAEQEGTTGVEREGEQVEARRWRPVDEAPPAYRDLVREYFREVQRLHESAGRDAEGRRAEPGGRP